LARRIDQFKAFKLNKDRENAFHTFAMNVLSQIHLRDKIRSIESYSETKLKERAIVGMRWYLQERKDKADMTSIAYAQLASTIMERTFIIFKYITS